MIMVHSRQEHGLETLMEDGIISTTTELCRRAGSRMLTENGISWHTMALCRLALSRLTIRFTTWGQAVTYLSVI